MRTSFNDHCGIIFLFTQLVVVSFGQAQSSPTNQGEFNISAQNAGGQILIAVSKVSGSTVHGSHCESFSPPFYAPTDSLTSWNNGGTSAGLNAMFTDRDRCGDYSQDPDFHFGYGLYEVNINGDVLVVDFRDADYENGVGTYGTGYLESDLNIYYDASTHAYYSDSELAHLLDSPTNVWDRLKDQQPPRFPFIVKCNSGRVIIDDTLQAGLEQDPSIELGYLISDI
jgi:hypothetical protein